MDSPDRAALVAFYDATGGALWTNNANRLSDATICQWYVVFTEADGRVIVLSIEDSGLSGAIPPELGSLHYLAHLDLRRNHLTGATPAKFIDLSGLGKLELEKTRSRVAYLRVRALCRRMTSTICTLRTVYRRPAY